MFARLAKIALIVCALLVVYWLGLIYSNRVRLATANVYYGLTNAWVERWPAARNKYAPQMTSALTRIGILRTVRMEVEPGISFLLDPHDLVSSALLSTKRWQPEIWNAIAPVLTEGSVFLDVGAHIGYFSMKASRKAGRTGRVLAFEPNPETLVLLRENVRVHVRGERLVAVAEPSRDDVQRHAGAEHDRAVKMAKCVEPEDADAGGRFGDSLEAV